MFDSKIKDVEKKTNLSLSFKQKYRLMRICGMDGDQARDALDRAVDLFEICKVPIRSLLQTFPEQDPSKLLRSVVENYIQKTKEGQKPARKDPTPTSTDQKPIRTRRSVKARSDSTTTEIKPNKGKTEDIQQKSEN